MPLSATILNSRQAIHFCRKDKWIQQTLKAIKMIKEKKLILYSSIGPPNWELLTALGVLNKLNLKLIIPVKGEKNWKETKKIITSQYSLNLDLTDFIPLFHNGINQPKAIMSKRDSLIMEQADILIPVSIRSKGNMETLIEQYGNNTKKIIIEFLTPHQKREKPLSYTINPDKINPQIMNWQNDYLIHWTRSFNSAWPTEKTIDFYRAISESVVYPRTAFRSLQNIITTSVIKASSKNMPDNTETVSFSNLSPIEMVPLFKWRSRYKQMSFEPYGIGIEKNFALSLNILPVAYYDKNKPHANDKNIPVWLTQSQGTKTNWKNEHEYRHWGDFQLTKIPANKMCLFCRTETEAKQITKEYGIRTISFERD